MEFGQSKEKMSLEYKTIVLEKLCRLKGTGELEAIIRKRGIQHIYLYGAGIMAELFYTALCAEQAQDYVAGVYDKRKQGKFQGMTIEYPDIKAFQNIEARHGDGRFTVLVTPSYEADEIKEELLQRIQGQKEVLTLKDLLE